MENKMDSAEDFVFFGTLIKCEEGSISRKNKTVAESSDQLQTIPILLYSCEFKVGRFDIVFTRLLLMNHKKKKNWKEVIGLF